MRTPTDEGLLADSLGNRPEAFELLVRRHSAELYRFVFRFTNSSAAAEDVVQETFLQAYLSASSFDPSRRFKPWLFTIAANKARDWLRGRSRRSEVALNNELDGGDGQQSFLSLLEGTEVGPDAELELDEKRRIVRSIVDQMPSILRDALVLAYYHRFSYREIAEVLGIPVGTVKSRLHSAVAFFGKSYRAACDRSVD